MTIRTREVYELRCDCCHRPARALDHHEMHGIWGGLSPDERNHLLAST